MRQSLLLALVLTLVGSRADDARANEGWRAANPEEKRMRETFLDAQGDWNAERDGVDEHLLCVMTWASWGKNAREQGDTVPVTAGTLTHVYADGQLNHHLQRAIEGLGGDMDAFGKRLQPAIQRWLPLTEGTPREMRDKMARQLGKCWVEPSAWKFPADERYTGTQFIGFVTGEEEEAGYPPTVRSPDKRRQYDELILAKDFPAAANLGAWLHGNGDKTSVHWNEVLAASLLSVSTGRGTQLDDGLLQVLSEVWWPKYRRAWAKNLLQAKRGGGSRPTGTPTRDDFKPKEPAWAKLEYQRYLDGRTSYTPCNIWHDDGC